MNIRLIFLVVVASAIALTAAGAAVASTSASATKSATFHLVEKDVSFNFVDNPPRQGPNAPPLAGDQLVFSSELQTRTGAHAGWLGATCTIAKGGTRAQGPCSGVFALKGGQLMAMAQLSFFGNAPTQIVIVGGTGVYQGVTGNIVSVSRGENSSFSDDTVTLTWP